MSDIVIFAPSPSIFGFGALKKLSDVFETRGFRRLLIITDPQIAKSGILEQVLDMLKDRMEWDLFDGAPTEPSSVDIDEQKEQFDSDYDAVVGIGGGSPMDFAKAMSIVMTHGGSLGGLPGRRFYPWPGDTGSLHSHNFRYWVAEYPNNGFHHRRRQAGGVIRIHPSCRFNRGPGANHGTSFSGYKKCRIRCAHALV